MNKLSVLGVVLTFLAMPYIGFNQENCDTAEFYELSLEKINSKKEGRFEISFDYRMSESLQESVFGSSILQTEEKAIVRQGLVSNDFIPFENVNKIISRLQIKTLAKDKAYTLLKYSEPIFVFDEKVLLFHEIIMKKNKHSSSKGGTNNMEVFIKVN